MTDAVCISPLEVNPTVPSLSTISADMVEQEGLDALSILEEKHVTKDSNSTQTMNGNRSVCETTDLRERSVVYEEVWVEDKPGLGGETHSSAINENIEEVNVSHDIHPVDAEGNTNKCENEQLESKQDNKIIECEEVQQNSKVSGYLYKKGRLRMVSSWKRYWFVLDGRLLIYYRSKLEYDTISPCKGLITLGSPCTIKPGSASNRVLQIEIRNNIITLRADNRSEQERWMLALLNALRQKLPPSGMSHFRYSTDDLAMRITKPSVPSLMRQNTMPDSIGSSVNITSKANYAKTVAQTYLSDQNMFITEPLKQTKASPKLPRNTNLKKIMEKQQTTSYSSPGEWINEDIETDEPDITIENDLYSTVENAASKDRHIYQEIPTESHVEPEVMVENANYMEVIVDHNKNKVEYCEPIYDLAKPEYTTEDIDTEPKLPPRPEKTESEAKLGKKQRRLKRQSFVFRMFTRKKRANSDKENENKALEKDDKPDEGVSDSQEEEKTKSDEQDKKPVDLVDGEESNLHDEVTNDDLSKDEKQEIMNDTASAEEGTSPVKGDANPEPKIVTEPASPQLQQLSQLQQPQLPLKQDDTNQPEITPTEELTEELTESVESEPKRFIRSNKTDFDYDLYDPSQRLNIPRPKLITKQKRPKRLRNISDPQTATTHFYQQFNESHDFQEQVVPHLKDDNKLMTIDEILDDLENHNYEPFSRQKVKQLIEKFNDTEHETDDDTKDEELIHIQLRRTRSEQTGELNSLLDELSKVAIAPVSVPDISNLNLTENEPFTEEEWKNIIPIRKRRHSDPDYDIPRPHSALHIIPNNEKEETRMQPTRFFGPVIMEQINGDTTSCGTSITPDSLEVDVLSYQAKNYTPSIEEDRSMRSYTSHIYASNDSHLNNNNYTHNSHTNQKLNAGGEHGGDHNKDKDVDTKAKSPSTLILPKTECEQAFYLNGEHDPNNNNQKLIAAVDNNDSQKFATALDTSAVGNMTSSVCYDSLEPSVGETQPIN